MRLGLVDIFIYCIFSIFFESHHITRQERYAVIQDYESTTYSMYALLTCLIKPMIVYIALDPFSY